VVGGAVGLNTTAASRDYIHLYRGDRDLAPTPGGVGTMTMPSIGSQTVRTLLGGGRPLARRDQLRPVSADT
jgi:5,10-methylene-tetrahydrofolate dehydrogenase/methenyl tetrahydrofolate cyclohydrolase